jgi:hypothetical protein
MGSFAMWVLFSWLATGSALAIGYALGRSRSRGREDELEFALAQLLGAPAEAEREGAEVRHLRSA